MSALERNELATGQLSSVLFCEPSSCSPRLFRLGLTFWTGFLFRWVYFSLLQISSHSSAEIIATFLGAYDPGLDGLWTCLPKNPFSVSSCHRRSSCDAVLAFCHRSLFSPTENHFLWVTVFSHGESKTNKIKQTKKQRYLLYHSLTIPGHCFIFLNHGDCHGVSYNPHCNVGNFCFFELSLKKTMLISNS